MDQVKNDVYNLNKSEAIFLGNCLYGILRGRFSRRTGGQCLCGVGHRVQHELTLRHRLPYIVVGVGRLTNYSILFAYHSAQQSSNRSVHSYLHLLLLKSFHCLN